MGFFQLFGWLFCRVHFENVVFSILTMMSIQGCANLHYQWSIMGEFTNLPQEELIHWIRYNTRPGKLLYIYNIKNTYMFVCHTQLSIPAVYMCVHIYVYVHIYAFLCVYEWVCAYVYTILT